MQDRASNERRSRKAFRPETTIPRPHFCRNFEELESSFFQVIIKVFWSVWGTRTDFTDCQLAIPHMTYGSQFVLLSQGPQELVVGLENPSDLRSPRAILSCSRKSIHPQTTHSEIKPKPYSRYCRRQHGTGITAVPHTVHSPPFPILIPADSIPAWYLVPSIIPLLMSQRCPGGELGLQTSRSDSKSSSAIYLQYDWGQIIIFWSLSFPSCEMMALVRISADKTHSAWHLPHMISAGIQFISKCLEHREYTCFDFFYQLACQ